MQNAPDRIARRGPTRAGLALVLAFACAIAAFLASTAYTERGARRIDAMAHSISEDYAPGVVYLATLRTELRQLEGLFGEPAATLRDSVERSGALIEESLTRYLALPVSPDEQAVLNDEEARALMASLRRSIDAVLARLDAGDRAGAAAIVARDLRPPADRLAEASYRLIEIDGRSAHDLALQIQDLRERTMQTAFALDAASALLSVLACAFAAAVARQHTRILEEHGRLVEERAAELEQFAARVAHDVLSPLQAAQMALRLVRRRAPDPAAQQALDRGDAAVARVAGVVDGLLAFARAGARPEPGERADVRAVLDATVDEIRPAADAARVTLSADAPADLEVACSPALLSVVVCNLAQNAIKYMGDVPERRVALRAVVKDDAVRVEVEDTGPGLPQALGASIFEPYVRGARGKQPGLGLGLATVKRVVEAHGGAVGARSATSAGTLFWVELPRAA
jgi:signal transduction histidine kinase